MKFDTLPILPMPTINYHQSTVVRFRRQFELLLDYAAKSLNIPKEQLSTDDLERAMSIERGKEREANSAMLADMARRENIRLMGDWYERNRNRTLVVHEPTKLAVMAFEYSPEWLHYSEELDLWRAIGQLPESDDEDWGFVP